MLFVFQRSIERAKNLYSIFLGTTLFDVMSDESIVRHYMID